MRFALAGNPNSGKTTLFNILTGSTAHVGNWPGVTVDRKEGLYKKLSEPITVVDLPGIYSLSPYTPEELVARAYIIDENPDLIINIVDATNLERNLYLTTQLLESECPMAVALNMMDEVERDGDCIDVARLERELGVPVVPISALKGEGIHELMKRAYKATKTPRKASSPLFSSALALQLSQIYPLLTDNGTPHPLFHAVKLIEGDTVEEEHLSPAMKDKIKGILSTARVDDIFEGDLEAAVADIRYRHITSHYKKALTRRRKRGELSRSDKIDNLLTSKVFGIPLFLFFMFLVFHLTFGDNLLLVTGLPSPGVFLQGATENLFALLSGALENVLTAAGASDWVLGLVVHGVVAGVGAVLSFLPQIMMLFLFLSIMEDSGYMARAAFLMDKLFRKFGLSGRSFLPLLMGFGCSVPAIMATRTLEREKDRRITVMLIPFFSCGAKLPIWSMFAAALFEKNSDIMVFGIYLIGILTAITAGVILKKTVYRQDASPFVMEMPTYRMPQLRNLAIHLWDKLKGFVFRATTIIATSTVVIWLLSNFTFTFKMVDSGSAESMLGIIGNLLRPVFVPLGFASGPDGWKTVVAILTGLIAKEMVVSSMGVLYNPSLGGDVLENETASTALAATIAAAFSPAAALSFMAFNLLSVPCMAAVAAAKGELRKPSRMVGVIGFWIFTAWTVSFVVYHVSGFIFSLI
ncbi:MAG: ferrous iron transport protein B [Eubacteriales bacterium]